MARKKSRAKVKKLVSEKVDVVFDCPFCDYPKCVECKLFQIIKTNNFDFLFFFLEIGKMAQENLCAESVLEIIIPI